MQFPSPLPILFLATLLGCSDPAATDSATAGDLSDSARVIDGDTLDVAGHRVRLFGIDAPEASQSCADAPCGRQATQALRSRIRGSSVSCDQRDVDRYDRIVAVCRVDGEDLGAWMVRHGWAVAYVEYSRDYVDAERDARLSGAGIWKAGNALEKPWEYRERQRTATTSPPPGRCAIKGNISSKGVRIFHSPGQADYDRTRISTGKGERWFCTAEEARAAGWRAAKR